MRFVAASFYCLLADPFCSGELVSLAMYQAGKQLGFGREQTEALIRKAMAFQRARRGAGAGFMPDGEV